MNLPIGQYSRNTIFIMRALTLVVLLCLTAETEAVINFRDFFSSQRSQFRSFQADSRKRARFNRERAKQEQDDLSAISRLARQGKIVVQSGNNGMQLDTILDAVVKLSATVISNYLAYKLAAGLFDNVGKFVQKFLEGSNAPPNGSANITKYLAPNSTLNAYEREIAESAVLDPEKVEQTFDQVGGLEEAKEALLESVQDLINTRYSGGVNSILLYGPPGNGKTALVKSLCRMFDFPVICMSPSHILRKYVGDSPQLIRAAFSLASKMQPCIIFFDEVDALCRDR